MPIYGGRRKYVGPKGLRASATELRPNLRAVIFDSSSHYSIKKRRRTLIGRGSRGYSFENTSLADIQAKLHFPLARRVKRLIASSKTKPVVVDWGCGNGDAIRELADRFVGKAKFIGFSDLAYSGWEQPTTARLVHGSDRNFFRYFKKNSIDLMYSFHGLEHVGQLDYVSRILPCLKVGGELVSTNLYLPTEGFPNAKIKWDKILAQKLPNKVTIDVKVTSGAMSFEGMTFSFESRATLVADRIPQVMHIRRLS